MAYRVVVDKPRRIRALASSANVVVADAQVKKSHAVVSQVQYQSTASVRVINALSSYAQVASKIYYQKPNAIDMALDPFSLNKYFRLEQFGISDASSFNVAKGFNEVVGASEQIQSFELGKGLADSAAIGDFAYILLEIQRSFSDAISYSDTQALGFGLGKADSIGAYDVAHRDLGKAVSDTPIISEVATLSVSANRVDTTTVSEALSRVVTYIRSFAEAANVNDAPTVLVGKLLQDSTPVSDVFGRVVTYNRGFTEAFGTADTATRLIGKSLAETASITDVLSRAASFSRSFSDAFTLDDFTDVNAIRKDSTASKNNVIGFSETQTFGTEKTLQDAAALTELAALSTERPAVDSFGVSDVFQKVSVYSRAFNDSASLAESRLAAFSKEVSDTAPLSDLLQKEVAFSRAFPEAVSFAEQSVAAFDKGLTDNASINETLQITTASLASSVLNASALNSTPLNN